MTNAGRHRVFKTILVPVDGSTPAAAALGHAADLARLASATVIVVTVPHRLLPPIGQELAWETRGETLDTIDDRELERARQTLAGAASQLETHGVPHRLETVFAEEPYEGILKAAADFGADLIVMGSHGRRGVHRLLLGSQATKVIALSTIPVLVCKSAAD